MAFNQVLMEMGGNDASLNEMLSEGSNGGSVFGEG